MPEEYREATRNVSVPCAKRWGAADRAGRELLWFLKLVEIHIVSGVCRARWVERRFRADGKWLFERSAVQPKTLAANPRVPFGRPCVHGVPTCAIRDRQAAGAVPDALRALGHRCELHDDHFPPATEDAAWLEAVADRQWVVLTKDEGITDASLRQAVSRAERGLVDADPGGGLIKQRVPRRGQASAVRRLSAAGRLPAAAPGSLSVRICQERTRERWP
jgi:hypothetical protein